jgi:hypothetical protein
MQNAVLCFGYVLCVVASFSLVVEHICHYVLLLTKHFFLIF